jgi:hypothetical protein
LSNWVVWKFEKSRDERETKVPYNARTGGRAACNRPTTWSSFSESCAALERGYNGLGFCLTEPYVGVDLDGCLDPKTEVIEPWAEEIIRELASYTERSPSGRGIRIMVKGQLPDGRRQKDFGGEHHGVGLYDAARGRYLTMTGARLNGNETIAERTPELCRIHARLFSPKAKPNAFDSDDDLIERARKAKDGAKFRRLFDDGSCDDYASPSEADLALCHILAFWTRRDSTRIDALFRRSALMREKWERKDYREQTIARAIERTSETWTARAQDQTSRTAAVDVDKVTPTIDLLNACSVFGGRIKFSAVKRRGSMIIAEFADHSEAIWLSMTDLMSFARSQAILAEATQMLIQTPSRNKVKRVWEPVVQLILRLAGNDSVGSTENALQDEFQHIVSDTWERADYPQTDHDDAFFAKLRECKKHKRDPTALKPPNHCVWHDQQNCYVHQPSLIEWLSTPTARNKQYDWTDVRNALLLLGFRPKQKHRSNDGETVNVRIWIGPLNLLVDDET